MQFIQDYRPLSFIQDYRKFCGLNCWLKLFTAEPPVSFLESQDIKDMHTHALMWHIMASIRYKLWLQVINS